MTNYTFVTLPNAFATNRSFVASPPNLAIVFWQIPDVSNNNDQMIVNNNDQIYLYSSENLTRVIIGRTPSRTGTFTFENNEPTFATSVNNNQEIVGVYRYF
jgi:hypothetical protein